ncbi:hypothetical protein BED16_07985 [Escherichia coli]|nr:hypothetical protein [Escherichia coli]
MINLGRLFGAQGTGETCILGRYLPFSPILKNFSITWLREGRMPVLRSSLFCSFSTKRTKSGAMRTVTCWRVSLFMA